MIKLVFAFAAVAVVGTAAIAFAQDKPAEPATPQGAAKPSTVPDSGKGAPGEPVKETDKAKPDNAPVKKPEEAQTTPAPATPAPAPNAQGREAATDKDANPPTPGISRAKPGTQADAVDKKPAEDKPTAKPPLEPVKPAAVSPAAPEKPAATGGEPTKTGEGEGVKATIEKKEEKAEGVQHIGGQTFYTEERTWYSGSTAVYTNTTGINPDQPFYTMSLKLLPKVNITDEFVITGRFDLIKEITNGVVNTAKRETQFGDARIEFVHTNLYKEKYSGIQFSGLLRLQLPTSKASQFATLRLGTMADLGVARTFFNDKLSIGYDFRFYKFFHKYTTSEFEAGKGGTYTDANGQVLDIYVPQGEYLNTGELNLDYQFAHIFAVSYAFTEKLSAIGYFWIINGVTYEPTGGGPRGNRDSLDFNVELDYMITKWFVVDAGFDTSQPQLTPDSTYPSNPVWRNTADNFTTVYFEIGFVL